MAEFVFWTCLALIAYTYIGYPILIAFLSRGFGRDRDAPACDDHDLPSVSLLIAAHDEEAVIEQRLRNALAADYPPEKIEIVVGSDGSTDGTAAAVRRCHDRRVRLLDYPVRRGKAAVINSAFPELRGQVAILSDANTEFDPAALRTLARWFRDPATGVVCGRLILTDLRSGRNGDGLYWRYETFLKRREARLGALLGSNGAIYAIRTSVFTPPPDGTIVEDLVIPLLARLRTGCSVLYEDEAIAREETPPDLGSEFRRRSRIGAGDFQSLGLLWRLLDPRRGWIFLTFFSHKILRWGCPFFMIGLLAASLALRDHPLYLAFLIAQVVFYAFSLALALVPARVNAVRPLRVASLFTAMNAALLVGFVRWLRGRPRGTWSRTARPAGAGGTAP
jgi:cellulose synthase/poly-beta-1,6-N-acetylglucosamine synthase-like glycosyltransferase